MRYWYVGLALLFAVAALLSAVRGDGITTLACLLFLAFNVLRNDNDPK